jgi:hypothetical protein
LVSDILAVGGKIDNFFCSVGKEGCHGPPIRDEGKDRVYTSTGEGKRPNQDGREGKWPPQGFGGTEATYGIGSTRAIS